MTDPFYGTQEWRDLRERVRVRDGSRCTVARLLGGTCGGTIHVHHIEPRSERPDLELDEDNCASVCASHHPSWEALRRALERSRRPLPPCGHRHMWAAGKQECDRRRARKLGIVLDDGLAHAGRVRGAP